MRMEGILKLWIPVFEENLPREILFRSITVVICACILGMCARCFGTEYTGTPKEAENIVSHMRSGTLGGSLAGALDIEPSDPVRNMVPPIRISGLPAAEAPISSERALPKSAALPESMPVRNEMPDTLPDIYEETDAAIREEDKEIINTPAVSAPEAAAVLKVYAYGNGGLPELLEISGEADTFSTDMLSCPKRAGKLFDGWYIDAACTVPFSEVFSEVTGKAESVELYAGWREYPGFTADDRGYITGCTGTADAVIEGLLRIPDYEGCTGIESGSFDGLEDSITEVFIPANITYIAPDAFDGLSNLMYFEVLEGNPAYYSEYGILYYSDGTEAVYPAGRKKCVLSDLGE